MNIKENRMLMKNGIYLKKKIKNIIVGDSSYYYDKRNKILVKDTVNKAFKSIEDTFGNKNRIAYGIIDKLTSPSKFRVKEVCPVAYKCGGCDIQHIDYNYQLTLNRETK